MQNPAPFSAPRAPTLPGRAAATPTGWLLAGRYRIQQRIGSGGMAEVFQARDELLARDVAVKVFRHHPDAANGAGGPKRQSIELQALARLSHPNLISLFDGSIGENGEPAYLVMELVHGPSLGARIAEAPLPANEVTEIAEQLADALSYVHSRDMVHRDIKPANILLGVDGVTGDAAVRARLSDFGIVRLLGSERLTSVDFLVGTASYLAPEQARGADVGPAADVYALGLVLLEALTGARAYDGSVLDTVTARLDRSPEIPQHFPAPWPALLQAMTTIEPELRPSAAEVARMLRAGRFTAVAPAGVAAEATVAGVTAPAELSPLSVLPLSGRPLAAIEDAAAADGSANRSRRLATRGLLAAAMVALAAAAAVEGVLLSRQAGPMPAPLTAPTVARSAAVSPPSDSPQPIMRSSGTVSSQPPRPTFAVARPAAPSSAAAAPPAPSASSSPSASPSALSSGPAPTASQATRTVTTTATAPAATPTASASATSSPTSAAATTSAPAITSSSPSVSPSTTPSGTPSPAGTSPAVPRG